jgi:hypothetical protein
LVTQVTIAGGLSFSACNEKVYMKRRVIDKRNKEKFQVDDVYFNGMARHCGISATGVYMILCRHANYKTQEAFPSKKLIAEKLGIGERTVFSAIKKLKERNIIKSESQGRKDNGLFNVRNYILIDKTEWKYPPQANIAVGKKQHSPQANNDTHRRQPLPKKETNKKETNNNIISSNEEKVFSYKEKLEGLRTSKRKDLNIIYDYLVAKKYSFDNEIQYEKEFKRCLRSAKYLKGYNQGDILKLIDYCKNKYEEWTIETLVKRSSDVINKK